MSVNVMGYRKLLGYTQKEFAKIYGISVQSLRNKEAGRTQYTDKEKVILRDLLRNKRFPNITVDDIFFN